MLVSRLVPLLVFGAIAAHSGGAIKERLLSGGGLGDKIVAKQRLHAIASAAMLAAASDEDELHIRSQAEFEAFVRRSVRISGNSRADASLDPWGTPLRGVLRGRVLRITSAGPDKRFGTSDDIADEEDVYNY